MSDKSVPRPELTPKTSTGRVQKYVLREKEWRGQSKRIN
jgi:fatty-acyl-CoA synthase